MGDAASAAAPSNPPPPAPVTHALQPQPSATNSSKRRWSPCTWRYAIEEVQPELGSRPRRDSYAVSANSAGHRERDRERASLFPEPSKRSASPDKPEVLNPCASQISRTQSPNKLSGEWTDMHRNFGLQQQRHGGERDYAAKNGIQSRGLQRDGEEEPEEGRKKRREEKEAMKRRIAEMEGHPRGRYEREMTPSELYFCDICSGRVRDGEGSGAGCG